MKVAIPVWNGYVSNVFDFANRLWVVEIEEDRQGSPVEVSLRNAPIVQRAAVLKELGADVLICGAVSRSLAQMVTAYGIEMLPFVTGRVEDVLQAYLRGQLQQAQFAMVCPWQGARRGFRRWRRRRGQKRLS